MRPGGACRDLSQSRGRRNKPNKNEIPQFFRTKPVALPPLSDEDSTVAPFPGEELDGSLLAPSRAFVKSDCIIETFSDAEAFSEEVESVALSVNELFADLGADCGVATAQAEVGCANTSSGVLGRFVA